MHQNLQPKWHLLVSHLRKVECKSAWSGILSFQFQRDGVSIQVVLKDYKHLLNEFVFTMIIKTVKSEYIRNIKKNAEDLIIILPIQINLTG